MGWKKFKNRYTSWVFINISQTRELSHRKYFHEFRKNRVHLQYAFWCAYNFYGQPSVSHQLSFHTKTRTISYMHIFLIFGRLYIISIFRRCITLIANSLCTHLHLAGYFLNLFRFKLSIYTKILSFKNSYLI